MRVAVLGLGEAGSLLAAELARAGDEVHGHDPAPVPTPPGVRRHDRAEGAVTDCALVLAVTPGSMAGAALSEVIDALADDALYADFSTASPALKSELAAMAAGRGLPFADVALMSAIPGRGLAAPALASGSGARQFADLINARGGSVDVVGHRAGEAATRKLLRSVVMKGIAALLIESMEAAEAHGESGWAWGHLVDQLTSIDVALMERLLFDTVSHAERRLEEMTAAQEMLIGLGVPADMTAATMARLRRLVEEGMPGISFG
jgi:3-hydroxyisobutyrate dehydrogenase-like beta-hydroxyacid dehydrogenase